MGNRSDCYGRGTALEGDKTTTGAECIASMSNDTEHGRRVVRVGDKTTPCPKCGEVGVIVSGEPRDTNNGKIAAVDGSIVRCDCPSGSNWIIAPAGQWVGRGPDPSIAALAALVAERKAAELNNWLKSVTAIVSLPNPAFVVKVVMMPGKSKSLILILRQWHFIRQFHQRIQLPILIFPNMLRPPRKRNL